MEEKKQGLHQDIKKTNNFLKQQQKGFKHDIEKQLFSTSSISAKMQSMSSLNMKYGNMNN